MAVISFDEALKNEKSSENSLLAKRKVCEPSVSDHDYFYEHIRFSYVTDIHLLHKVRNLKPKTIQKTIKDCVDNIVEEYKGIILLGGDISSDYIIFEQFVKTLRESLEDKRWHPIVIFVLGNHELWSFPGKTIDEITNIYINLLNQYGMYLLQNSVFYMTSEREPHQISEQELETMDLTQIYDTLNPTKCVIFGGLAFSGYNNSFNANTGLYQSIINRDEEIAFTKRFEALYNKLEAALPDKKLIVLTHTPMDCWRQQVDYHNEYIYVSGHNHNNHYYDDGYTRIYADNQIGYTGKSVHMKHFDVSNEYDYFSNYDDGIHEITKDAYIQFYRGINIRLDFNRTLHKLYMLKKHKYYCFIHQSKSGSLTILNGGALKKLPRRPIEYFYVNMDRTISRIESPLGRYSEYQERISKEVMKIGGSGKIHGCIIDIDYNNHIYVNPIDMKIVAYWAADIVDKLVFPSIPSLLESHCPGMFRKYVKRIESSSKDLPILRESSNTELSKRPKAYLETDIYKASREIKKMQKLHSNILSVWYEPNDKDLLIEDHSLNNS